MRKKPEEIPKQAEINIQAPLMILILEVEGWEAEPGEGKKRSGLG